MTRETHLHRRVTARPLATSALGTAVALVCLALTGCFAKPVRVKPASFARIDAKHTQAAAAVEDAKERNKATTANVRAVKAASASVTAKLGSAQASHSATAYRHAGEAKEIERLKAELASAKFANAPPELREDLKLLGDTVNLLAAAHAETDASVKAEGEDLAAAVAAQQEVAPLADKAIASAAAVATAIEIANARMNEEAAEFIAAKASDLANVTAANANADGWEAAQKLADKRGNLIGLAFATALGVAGFMLGRLFPPWGMFAGPVIGAVAGYFGGRLFL